MVPVLRILIALVLGLATGATLSRTDPTFGHIILQAGQLVGGLWINALRMTVIPLVLALIVSGVAAAVAAARAGKLTSRISTALRLRLPQPYLRYDMSANTKQPPKGLAIYGANW